ncbi:MAG: sterol desaturase family protein [Solirubrobacteraceae bacterium]
MTGDDPLSAPADAVPPRRGGPHTLGDCWRAFWRRPSPPFLLAGLAIAVALRFALGHWSWRDALVATGVVVVTPFVEWAIHVYLLHSRPVRLGARRFDLPTTSEHRAHHLDPAKLDGVLIPVYGVLIFLAMIAATTWVLSFPIHAVIGGDRLSGAASGLLISCAILFAYEWAHFLIHTPYRPHRRYYRALWRNHRLHHYKNEHYWFGVTSTLGDRVIGTAPDQSTVQRSPTARSLQPGD